MNTFSLLSGWEFHRLQLTFTMMMMTRRLMTGYSTSLYAKYMFYENDSKTGGFAVKLGTGLDPGYLMEAIELMMLFKPSGRMPNNNSVLQQYAILGYYAWSERN